MQHCRISKQLFCHCLWPRPTDSLTTIRSEWLRSCLEATTHYHHHTFSEFKFRVWFYQVQIYNMDYSIFEKLIKIWSSPYLKSGLVQMLKKHSKKFNLDLIFFPSIVFACPDLEYRLIQIWKTIVWKNEIWTSPYPKFGLVQMLYLD